MDLLWAQNQMLHAEVLALRCFASQFVAAPPVNAGRARRPRERAPGHVKAASSDLLTLPEREREADERLEGKVPSLEEAIGAHLGGAGPVLRRDLRVLVARDRVDGDLREARVAQLAAFRKEVAVACESLALSKAETECISSAFLKAGAHRVDPMKHERRAIRVLSGCAI